MKYTHHSEYHTLVSVFLKTAEDAFVNEEKLDAEWEELNYLGKPDFLGAVAEYGSFEVLLRNEGIAIHYFPKDKSLTLDAMYCRDASIATDYGMIICNMGKMGRVLEPKTHADVYVSSTIPILGAIRSPGTLEGGDVAWLNQNTLAVGLSYRTNEEGILQLTELLAPHGVEVIGVDLPHYRGEEDVFHLMSIFSPIDRDLAVVYSPLMPIRFRKLLLTMGYRLIEVPDDEFEQMGCNVLAISARKCVMVAGNPKTRKALENEGCRVMVYKGDEISSKGGGGPTCLTRPVLRKLN